MIMVNSIYWLIFVVQVKVKTRTGSYSPIKRTGSYSPIMRTGSPSPIMRTGSPSPIKRTGSPSPSIKAGQVVAIVSDTAGLGGE